MKPNTKFSLTVRDVDIIEHCLRDRQRLLGEYKLTASKEHLDFADQELTEITDLLARIHDKKIWYRPKKEVYISG